MSRLFHSQFQIPLWLRRGTLEVCFTQCNAWSSSNSKKKLSNISANCLTFRHIWLSRRWNANTSVENCFFNLAVVDFFVIMRWDIFCHLAKWIQYAHYSKMSSSSNSPSLNDAPREMSCGLLWVSISWHVTPPLVQTPPPIQCKADFFSSTPDNTLFHGPFLVYFSSDFLLVKYIVYN